MFKRCWAVYLQISWDCYILLARIPGVFLTPVTSFTHVTHDSPEQGEVGPGLPLLHVILGTWWRCRGNWGWKSFHSSTQPRHNDLFTAPLFPAKCGDNQVLCFVSYCVCATYYRVTINACGFTHFLSLLIHNGRHITHSRCTRWPSIYY